MQIRVPHAQLRKIAAFLGALALLFAFVPAHAIAQPDGSLSAQASPSQRVPVKSQPGTWQDIPVYSDAETDGSQCRDLSVRAVLDPAAAPAGSDVFIYFVYGGHEEVEQTDEYSGFYTWGFFMLSVNGSYVDGKGFEAIQATFLRTPMDGGNARIDRDLGLIGLDYAPSPCTRYVYISDGNDSMKRYIADGSPITFNPINLGRPGATAEFELYAGFPVEQDADEPGVMHRLYNPNSGEHFYTSDAGEKAHLVSLGWNSEGKGWKAPETGVEVFRLYNAAGGEHHYTTNAAEKDALVGMGWDYEGVGWYSESEDGIGLMRLYNPNAFANNHHYTTDGNEKAYLISIGWQDEGIGWYGVK